MDHSTAHLMELSNNVIITTTIKSKPQPLEDQQNVYKDESHILNKEHNQLSAYFKKISDEIRNYEEVLLFGPSEAKNELLNLLKGNHLFDKIKIKAKPADKMTGIKRVAFVKEYYNSTW